MAEYQIHNIALSSIEVGICEELEGETFFAKDDADAELKANEMLKEKLGGLSEESFDIDIKEVVETQSGTKI